MDMGKEAKAGDGQLGGQVKKPLLHLVEDDVEMRGYLNDELMDTYRVSTSSDGLTGYQKALTERPDIIVSDIAMPGMDGLLLCTKLKTDPQTCHIPIVLLTGRTSDDQTLAGLACGADDYVSKPFNLLILKAKLSNLVKSRDALRCYMAELIPTTLPNRLVTIPDETFLRKAHEIVEQNLSNAAFEANDFAKAVGMSRAQLYRKLHVLSGQTVKEFIRVIRLKKALDLIVSTEHNISQAAFDVGFNSVAYFTRAFKDYFGDCPTKYMARKLPNP